MCGWQIEPAAGLKCGRFPLQKTREAVEGAISSAKRIIEALKRGDKLVEGCPLGVVRRESDQAWVGELTI